MLNRLLGITSSLGFGNKDGVIGQSGVKVTSSLFAQLHRHDSSFRGCVHMRTLGRAQHLFRPADTRSCVYSIYAGALKSYRSLHDGNEKISGFHFTGELLGLDALFGRPLRRGAVALNSATVFVIPVPMIIEHLGRCAVTRSELLARFYKEIVELEEHLSLENLGAERRLATFVLWAADKLAERSPQASLPLPMSQKDIGNYLGLVPETVSRVLARFQDRQWLSIERHNLTVRNWQRLRETAGGLEGGGLNGATAAAGEH
jgi:CRP/FNR family transcriptional regulator